MVSLNEPGASKCQNKWHVAIVKEVQEDGVPVCYAGGLLPENGNVAYPFKTFRLFEKYNYED